MCDICTTTTSSDVRGDRRCRHGLLSSSGSRVFAEAHRLRRGEQRDHSNNNNGLGEAMFGGFMAGVILGGPVGGIIGGLGAAGVVTIAGKRDRDRRDATTTTTTGMVSDTGRSNLHNSTDPFAPFLSTSFTFSSPSLPSSTTMTVTTEQAMVATGRAMASGHRLNVGTTFVTTREDDDDAAEFSGSEDDDDEGGNSDSDAEEGSDIESDHDDGDYVAGAGGDDGDDENRSDELSIDDDVLLPSARLVARPVVQAIAIPCNSRLVRAQGLTAVTATPASESMAQAQVQFGIPLPAMEGRRHGSTSTSSSNDRQRSDQSLSSDRGNSHMINPTTTTATATGRDENPQASTETESSFLARITCSGRHSAHTTRTLVGARSHNGDPPNTERTALVPVDLGAALRAAAAANHSQFVNTNSTVVGGGAERGHWQQGGTGWGSVHERDSQWWSGEEFEDDWGCIFDAYLCINEEEEGEEGDGRLPCVAAREPLQGSGVTGRVARRALRIADWHENERLDRDEFTLAMYLCRRHREGEGIPSKLETWMLPPRLREVRGCRPNSPCPAVRRQW